MDLNNKSRGFFVMIFSDEEERLRLDVDGPPLLLHELKAKAAKEGEHGKQKVMAVWFFWWPIVIAIAWCWIWLTAFAPKSVLDWLTFEVTSLFWVGTIGVLIAFCRSLLCAYSFLGNARELQEEHGLDCCSRIRKWMQDPEIADYVRMVTDQGRKLTKSEVFHLELKWIENEKTREEAKNREICKEIYLSKS